MATQKINEERQVPLSFFPEQSELTPEEVKAMRGMILLQHLQTKEEEAVVESSTLHNEEKKKDEPTDWIGKKAKTTTRGMK